jgi:hypothetical protein
MKLGADVTPLGRPYIQTFHFLFRLPELIHYGKCVEEKYL